MVIGMKLFIGTYKNQLSFNGLMINLVLYQTHWTRRTELLAYSRCSCWHIAGASVGIQQVHLLAYSRCSCWHTAGASVGIQQVHLLAYSRCICWHTAGAAVSFKHKIWLCQKLTAKKSDKFRSVTFLTAYRSTANGSISHNYILLSCSMLYLHGHPQEISEYVGEMGPVVHCVEEQIKCMLMQCAVKVHSSC
jgi:hypothetical protein